MTDYRDITKKIKSPIGVGFFILSISIIVVIISSQILYKRTVDLLTDNLRERLLTISITAAANIDPNDLEQLQIESDWQKPEWANVVNKLHRAKYSNKDIVFMYIFRLKKDDPSKIEFVADADSIDPYANVSGDPNRYVDVNRDGIVEPDGADALQWPGQEDLEPGEKFDAFYKNEPMTSAELYTDAFGTVLTGYAPIKNQYGKTVAILATDIKADDFFVITRQTLQPFIIFIVVLAVIISTLIIIIIYTWKKYALSLERLNQQVKEANNKLKELDSMKSEFLSLATHQIRSPLTAIKGYSSMLLEDDYGKLPKKAHEAVGTILTSSQNLIDIVGDFLDISRIEQGRMVYNKEKFDVVDAVKEVAKSLEPNAQKAGLELKINIKNDYHATIEGDEGKIKQVVGNMIDNAIKYTLKGSVTIEAENIKTKYGEKIKISVTDTGIGIDEEEMPKLFAKFSRTKDAHKQNVSGTGLGLYIAKRMLEAHSGTIGVTSQGHGKGSTFHIELPVIN